MPDDTKRFVEPLPDKPSLERQQKLAKQLLRAVWAGEAEAVERFDALHPSPPAPDQAKLADAQLVVARGYGFQKWADLKHKIESLTQTPRERWVAALKAGDVERVRSLLDEHAELRQRINEPSVTAECPAIFAAKQNLPLLDLLIEYGADVNQKSDWWAGGFGLAEDQPREVALPLFERGVVEDIWVAVRLDHFERVNELLDADPSLITARGGDGKHPLHYAQTPAMVDLLIERGAEVDAKDVDHTSTPAQYLVRNEPVVRRLLERGATPDIFLAAALGDLALVERCLAENLACVTHRLGVEPWVNDASGMIYNWTLGHALTPQEVAAQRGHDDALDVMLDASPPKTRFLAEAWRGDAGAARAVREAHPQAWDAMTDDDHAALNRACWWHRPEAVTAMLALGFNRHIQDNERMTPLDRAAFHGHADCLAQLLEGDPDPPLEWVHQYDGTPIQTCVHGAIHGWETGFEQDHARCAELLIDAGAHIEPGWLPTGHDGIDAVLRRALAKR